jgi:hypothetical protein
MKKFRFPENILNYIYQNISFNVKSKTECAANCNIEPLACDGLFYNRDGNFCSLLSLTKFGWKRDKKQTETPVYLNLGIFLLIYGRVNYFSIQCESKCQFYSHLFICGQFLFCLVKIVKIWCTNSAPHFFFF